MSTFLPPFPPFCSTFFSQIYIFKLDLSCLFFFLVYLHSSLYPSGVIFNNPFFYAFCFFVSWWKKRNPSSGVCSRTGETDRPSKDHFMGGLRSSTPLARLSPESTTFTGDSFQASPLLGSASSLTHETKAPACALSFKNPASHEWWRVLFGDANWGYFLQIVDLEFGVFSLLWKTINQMYG